jgi:hypothetical protein
VTPAVITASASILVAAALAILGQPVPPSAVDVLLNPYLPGNRSLATLERLCRRRVIGREGELYYIPSAEDTALILEGVPPGDPSNFDEDRYEWTRPDLAIQAAEYHVAMANPEPRRVQDLGAQFSEVEQRIRGGDFEGAVQTISEMDDRWLRVWGQRHLAIPWLKRLLPCVTEVRLRISILSMLANAHMEIGKYREATDNVQDAHSCRGVLSEPDTVRLFIQAGTTMYEHGQVSEAKQHYSNALSMASGERDVELAVKARSGLMLCCTELGEMEAASDHRYSVSEANSLQHV